MEDTKLQIGNFIMNKMFIVDLETQSFPVESGIFEVACLAVENYEIVGELYLGKSIKGYVGKRTHGFGFHDISKDMHSINKFKSFLRQYKFPIVAHNCPFDKKFLQYYGWVAENYPFYCSMQAIKKQVDYLDSYSMASLVKQFGIADSTDHQAMSDVLNLFQLLKIIQPKHWVPVVSGRRWIKTIKPRPLESIDLNIKTTKKLISEKICFTGESKFPRNIMQEIALKNGADLSSSITLTTTMLVVGVRPGRKLDRAQEKKISIISDEDFLKMLDLEDVAIEA